MNRIISTQWLENNIFNVRGYVDGNKVTIKWHEKHNTVEVFLEFKAIKVDNKLQTFKEAAFWIKNDLYSKPACVVCGKHETVFNAGKYSKTCASKSCRVSYHEKQMLEKYGTTNYAKTEVFKDAMISKRNSIEKKKKETCLEKYGVDNVMKSQHFKDKLENSMVEKFRCKTNLMCLSDESIEKRINILYSAEFKAANSERQQNFSTEKKQQILSKRRQTLINKYGSLGEAYKQKHEKSKATNLERHGVENPQQVPEFHEKQQKSRYKWKEVVMPSGKIIKVQGYEDRAIKHMLKTKMHEESQIETVRKNMPEIWYSKTKDSNNRYYPDVFIVNKNKIIEVKSDYTMLSNLDVNYKKRQACLDKGYTFEFWIYSENKLYII